MRARAVTAFAAGPLITAIRSVASIPLLAHVVSVGSIGRYYLLQTCMTLGTMVLGLGLDQAYVREFHSRLDRDALLRACSIPVICMAAAAACAVAAFRVPIAEVVFGRSKPSWGLMLGLCILFGVVARSSSLVLRMHERGMAFSLGQVLPKVSLLAALILIECGLVASGFGTLSLSYSAALAATGALYCFLIRGDIKAMVRPHGTVSASKLLAYGVPLAVSGLMYWLLTSSGAWAVRWLAGFRELGLYSMTLTIAGVATLVQAVFGVVWGPIAFSWVAAEHEAAMKIRFVTRCTLVGVCTLCAVVGALGPVVGMVMPTRLGSVEYLLPGALLPALLYTAAEASGVGVNIARRTVLALGVTSISAICNGVCLVVLVPPLGAAGAVTATVASFLIYFWMRTVASAIVWRSLRLTREYLLTTSVACLAICEAFVGQGGGFWSIGWIAYFGGVAFVARDSLAALARALSALVVARRTGRESRV